MQLKKFITSTLIDIVEGVCDARCKYNELGGSINPTGISHASNGMDYVMKGFGPGRSETHLISKVDFEVTLTEMNSSEGKGGIGVYFGAVGIGATSSEKDGASSLTKVKFSVPVKFPTHPL